MYSYKYSSLPPKYSIFNVIIVQFMLNLRKIELYYNF